MNFISILKKIPIDFGQANLRRTTYGKIIAMSHISLGHGKKALDIGCREGYQSQWLEQNGYVTTSIDIEKKYSKCIVVDVNKGLPFRDEEFDLIWCSEVIEHLIDLKFCINEFKRVLKTNGKMVLTTPNSHFWLYTIAKIFNKTPKDLQNKDHKYFFSEDDIRMIFPKSKILGFFPYIGKKFAIKKFIGFLSPTFVIIYFKSGSQSNN